MKFASLASALITGLCSVSASSVRAQSLLLNAQSYALKSGESVEVGDIYYLVNCRSLLTSPPEVTVMDGPPGVTATVPPPEAENVPELVTVPLGSTLVVAPELVAWMSPCVIRLPVPLKL